MVFDRSIGFFDVYVDWMIESASGAMKIANRIGLKRRIGHYLKKQGYLKIRSTPPIWVKKPLCQTIILDIPQWTIDTYLSLLQAQAVIEKEYPDIEKAVVPA